MRPCSGRSVCSERFGETDGKDGPISDDVVFCDFIKYDMLVHRCGYFGELSCQYLQK